MPIVGSPHGSLEPYPNLSLAELMVGSIDRWGDRVALVDGVSGAEYDFRALGRAMQVVGGLLRDDGVEPGDRVAIVAPNSTEWIAAFLGIQAAGAAVTTLSPLSRRREVEQQFADSKPSAVFVGGEATTVVRTLWGSDERIYDMSSVWQMVVQGGGRSRSVRTAPGGDVAVVAYSSGTTGMPKGVMLTNRNLVANVHQLLAPGPLDDSSVMVDFLPFSHIYGMVGLMACGLVAGARQVVMPGFDPLLFARLVEEHQATNLFVVPPVMLDLAQGLEGDWSSVTHVMTAAAPVSAHVVSAVEEACGARVYEGYGLTEASPATNSTMCGPVRFGTVGQPLPDTLEMVVDVESGRAVAFGEVGELWVQGPQVMAGYLNSPEATASAIVEDESGRWLRTGDIVTMDTDGYVTIRDRAKEMIKFRGYQVAPAELESVLLEHPGVADAAVVPVRVNGGDGEIPKAFVVVVPGTDLGPEEVVRYVSERVAPYKKVREVEFIEAIPRSPTGKILRRDLRE